jgi:hypothetical protein
MQGSFPKVVAQGLDSLWVTTREPLKVNLAVALERAKQKAQDQHRNVELNGWQWGGAPLYVMPGGARGFRFLAHNEFGQLAMNPCTPKAGGWSTVRARLSSEWLHMAPAGALAEAEEWLRTATWMDDAEVPSVSEAHYHVDLEGYVPSSLSRWVCRAGQPVERHYYTPDGERRPESLLFGVKGSSAVQVGVYNKVREMERPGRADPVLRAVWDANGYSGGDVYRVETRYFREFLRQRGVETVPELRAKRAGLWAYATQEWVREAIGVAGDDHSERWAVSDGWEYVSSHVFEDATPAPKVDLTRIPDTVRLVKQAVGCISSATATMRAGGAEFVDAWDVLMGDPEVGHELRGLIDGFADRSARKARELGLPVVGEGLTAA